LKTYRDIKFQKPLFLYNAYILPYVSAVSFNMLLIYAIYSIGASFCVI